MGRVSSHLGEGESKDIFEMKYMSRRGTLRSSFSRQLIYDKELAQVVHYGRLYYIPLVRTVPLERSERPVEWTHCGLLHGL